MGRPHLSDFATQVVTVARTTCAILDLSMNKTNWMQSVFVKVLALFPNVDKRRARRMCSRWKCVLSKKLAIMRQLFLPINDSVIMKDELLSAYMDCCICEEEALRSYTEHTGTRSSNGRSNKTLYRSRHASKAYGMPYKSEKSRVASRRLSEISRIISRSNRSPDYTPESPSSDVQSYRYHASPPRRQIKDSRHPEGPNFNFVTDDEDSSRSHKSYIRPSEGRDDGICYKASSSLIDYPSEQPLELASPPEEPGPWTNSTDEPNDRIARDVGLDSSDMVRNYNHRNDTTFRSHGLRYYKNMDKSSGRDSPSTNVLYTAQREPNAAPLSLSCATCTVDNTEYATPTSRSPYRATSYNSHMSSFGSTKRRDFTDEDERRRNENYSKHHHRPQYPREPDDGRESRYSKHYERSHDGAHSSKYPPQFKSLGQPQSHRYSPTHSHRHHDVLRGQKPHKGRGYIEHRFHRRRPKEKSFQPHDIEPYLKHSDNDTASKHQEDTRSRLDHISNIVNNPKVKHIRTSRNYSHRSSRGPSSRKVVVKKRKRSRK